MKPPMVGKIQMADEELEQSIKDFRPAMTIQYRVDLDDGDLAQLTMLLGRNIATADDLMSAAKAVTTLSVDGIDITLDSYLLNRLKSRCHPTQDFPTFLRDRVKELLASYAGC